MLDPLGPVAGAHPAAGHGIDEAERVPEQHAQLGRGAIGEHPAIVRRPAAHPASLTAQNGTGRITRCTRAVAGYVRRLLEAASHRIERRANDHSEVSGLRKGILRSTGQKECQAVQQCVPLSVAKGCPQRWPERALDRRPAQQDLPALRQSL